jgi:L-alanine-DL-glutamate epimerase-like enolase superfamily enzyme
MRFPRRHLLQAGAAAALAGALPDAGAAAPADEADAPGRPLLQLGRVSTTPLRIASVEVLRSGPHWLVRSTTTDGATGLAVANDRVRYLYPILQQLVIPYFLRKDARDLEELIDGVYLHQSNYKLAGLALWCCVSWVEFSLFDLLGKVARKPVGALLGRAEPRREIPVYLSSMRRDTTPEQEVASLGRRLEETGARAVKLKIGGRMSNNRDASPGRTERLVALARRTWGDRVTIYVDANGSYNARHAIEVGRMLEGHGVGFFEEPCPFDEYDETKRVADALTLPVAGGEQDTSWARFRWMVRRRGLDVVQPDVSYNGGFLRALRVARLAASANVPITPHSSRLGPHPVYTLHLVSAVPNAGPFQEYNAAPHAAETWCTPALEVRGGALRVPDGPGLGLTIDPDVLRRAERLPAQ